MTISNWSPPPRASTSSTARAPAMPLPMTTSFSLVMSRLLPPWSDFQHADVDHQRSLHARRRGEEHFELGFGKDVLDDGERNVFRTFRGEREIAHRLAVAHQ